MRAGQLAFELALQPQARLAVLALRAVAVATGGGHDVRVAAVLALVADRAEGLGAALAEGLDDLAVRGGDRLTEALQIGGRILAKDGLNGAHVTGPPSAC